MSKSTTLNVLLVPVLAALVVGISVESAFGDSNPKPTEYSAYLMAYFTDYIDDPSPDRAYGLRYAYSKDARNWKALNNGKPVFDAKAYLRDPFISRVKGKFHMVHTKGMEYPTIFHWESTDLINWKGGEIDVVPPSGNKAWAPEFFYVESEDLFYVYWASNHDDLHKMHYVTTKDWTDITPERSDIFYDIGMHDIDLTIVEHDGTYYGFHKPGGAEDKMGNRLSVSKSLKPGELTFGKDGPGKVVMPDNHPGGTEGPEVIKLIGQDKWYIYGDPFGAPLEAWETADFVKYTKIPVTTPKASKHCSMIQITQKELDMLLEEYPSGDKLVIRADLGKDTINKNIYGHFSEHLGRCVYEGYWVGEDSPIPNTRGIRNDVVEALKKIKVPVLRWPGGCFADEYHWKDGIGPREDRPSMINSWWGGVTENNHFGTHEFLDLCEMLECEPYINGNVGSGTVQELSEWVEYVNFDGQSPMADLRRANGREKPWKVKFWGIGNENWGCGGNMTPAYYADMYRRFQTYVRNYPDADAFKIACGPYGDDVKWMETMMENVNLEMMQSLDLHYYCETGKESASATEFKEIDWFHQLKRALELDPILEKQTNIMDKYDPENRVELAVGEWGAWHNVEPGTNEGFLYQQNSLRDAMVAGSSLNIMNQHCGRVKMANIAQTVNVLQAMILTDKEKMILTPTYHVFDMYKVHQDATLLPSDLKCEDYGFDGEDLPGLNVSASKDKSGKIHVSICNLNPNEDAQLTCEIRGAKTGKIKGRILTAEKMTSHNTFKKPEVVKPEDFKSYEKTKKGFRTAIPAKSIVVFEIE